MRTTLRQKLLTSTLLFGAAAIATPAWAQPTDSDVQENAAQTDIDTDSGEGSESIVVTGSRIQRRDLTSTSPLAVVQDEEFKLSGSVNVEQVINTLPQVIPGTTSFSNNPGGGVATLNLRGLGSTRTLVLVNGRRYVSFDVQQIVDLNTIPAFLIDSVDVVTGGASAVYGSDALAGVVNFRLKQDLNGFEAGTQYSITEEGDGSRFNAYVALGADFADGRGNVTVFGEYFKRKPIFAGDRPFSRFTVAENAAGTALIPGGSSAVPEGRFTVPASTTVARDLNADGDTSDPGESTTINRGAGTRYNASNLGAFFSTPGTSRAYVGATDAYNYAPSNYLQVPQERFLLGGYGSYEVSDAVTAFAEVTFINNRVQNELAPTPVTGTYNINIAANLAAGNISPAEAALLTQLDAAETAVIAERARLGLTGPNPFGVGTFGVLDANQPGIVALGVNRRITETGPRNQFDERNAFRVLAGVKGPLFSDFTYEAYYSYARTRNAQVQSGNISRSAIQRAAEQGTINIFGPNTLDQEALDLITITAQNQDISVLQVANASIAGSLGNFGLGADNIGLAVGFEWRSQSSQFIPDTALSSGDVIGFNGGDPTQGSYNVYEGFAELRVPIIADRPFFERLEVTGAFRYSDYSLNAVGGVETYAAGVEWAPVRDITFRGQYQRAVRAPNVGELFGGQSNGFPAANDPCSSRAPAANQTAAIRALCIQTGVPSSAVFTLGVQPDPQIEGLFGGNPDLQEETSDTYTVGAVIRPSFIPRLNISIDYFDITVDNLISTFGGGLAGVLDLCYNQIQDVNSVYCQAIINGTDGPGGLSGRDPNTGEIGDVFLVPVLNANVAKLEATGIDLQVDYSLPLNFSLFGNESSRLNFFFLGTWTDKNDLTPVVELPDIVNECSGRFGISICGEPTPSYKWTTRVSLIDGGATLSGRWRHLSGVDDDDDASDYFVERIGSYDLFDLSLAYDLTDQFSFAVGVNNIFDKDPPTLGNNQEQSNTYPDTYDPIGRDFFVSASFRF